MEIQSMFGLFSPSLPLYKKRSSFFIIALQKHGCSAFTYNWKKSQSYKIFLQILKVFSWATIQSQFQERLRNLNGLRLEKLTANISQLGATLFGDYSSVSETSDVNLTKFRGLDFLYHIGSFDAILLQKQIVDFLEHLFRNGRNRFSDLPQMKNICCDSPHENLTGATLSLSEMSLVLQSVKLIHSSSAPIFFSECRETLMSKWELLNATLGPKDIRAFCPQPLSKSPLKLDAGEQNLEWFTEMIKQFETHYISYLEHLGMEKVVFDNSTSTFNISSDILIAAPTVFMVKFFTSGAILTQLGFYEYFASINVLTFAFNEEHRQDEEFEKETQNMKLRSNIVSFSYDFHLRYIQEILVQTEIEISTDLIRALRCFVSLNPEKARFSRNRIVHGRFEMNGVDSELLFRYVLKNANEKYKFTTIHCRGKVIGTSLSTDDPTFRNRRTQSLKNAQGDYDYSLVICPTEKGLSEPFGLEYFILVANKSTRFPLEKVRVTNYRLKMVIW